MAKIKLHNKGQKIIAINGEPLLPGNTVEVDFSFLKTPVIDSLIRQGFLESNAQQPSKPAPSTNNDGGAKTETPNT